jgi:hypothetical protein
VEGFISYSLSVQNRRKSRAGSAFEDHVKHVLDANAIVYSKGQYTEHKSKPDFLFPHIRLYSQPQFPPELLTMLGVKTSLKDRWRQVLSEAVRIPVKHLITLEPGVSEFQTKEMQAKDLKLVVPHPIHQTFSVNQRHWLMTVKDFIVLVRQKQQTTTESGYQL